MTSYKGRGDYCDNCKLDFYNLIDLFVKDIQHLESKVVYLRYLLSQYFPECDGEMLRCDIFNDLAANPLEQSAYHKYLLEYCGGHDPMDNGAFVDLLIRLSRGEDFVGL